MKPGFILFLLLLVNFSCFTQQSGKPQTYVVDFLPKEMAAKAILDESYEAYFSQLQKREIAAFVNQKVPYSDLDSARAFARKEFSSAVLDFTENEKNCISFVLDKVNQALMQDSIFLMAEHPWQLIKIDNWLCGGFAHTRGTYIILSQRHLDHLMTGWSDDMTSEEEKTLLRNLGGLLVHEQMHSLQRAFKSKFNSLYTSYWNFIHANVHANESIQIDQVSNPDAPIAEWLIPNEDEPNSFYWVRTLFKGDAEIPQMGKDFIDKVFIVEKTNNEYYVKKDAAGKLVSTDLSNISFYVNSFPVSRGIDHPNEISAYMFADYFRALISDKKAFKDVNEEAVNNTELFLSWIEEEMKTRNNSK